MRERRAVAGALIAAVACGGVAWGVVASEAGCQLQGVCDATTVNVPTDQAFQPGAGIYATSAGTVWQSSPFEGTWMSFPAQRTYVIYPKLADGSDFDGPYTFPQVEISADPAPYSTGGANSAPSAGNGVEIMGLTGAFTNRGFAVTNNTCSPYYLWLQVAQEYTPDAGAGDAGNGADASDSAASVQIDASTLAEAGGN